MPECIKEVLNSNAIKIQDLIDDENPPPASVLLTHFPPNQTIHHKDEHMLLATDDLSEDNNMHLPEDTTEELIECLLACMDDPQTIVPPSNASLDNSSLIDASNYMSLMDGMNANTTSSVPTQASAAHVPTHPTVAPQKLPVDSVMPTQLPPLPATLPPESHTLTTIASPYDALLDHS